MSFDKLSDEEVIRYRRTGARGSFIEPHHSLRSIVLTRSSIMALLLLPLFFELMLWINLDAILGFWDTSLSMWINLLDLPAKVLYKDINILGTISHVPFPDVASFSPSTAAIWYNIVACLLIFLVSLLVPSSYMPIAYFIRALVFVQLSASAYFLISGNDAFPYTIGDYISGCLSLGVYLLFITPPVLALIYYIFDFSFWRKTLVTATMLLYFIVFIPFQYLLHTVVLNAWGILFMPVLYLNFGLLVDTLMFIGWYAWAMTAPKASPDA